MSLCADLKQTIHRADPFAAFEAPDLAYDLQGWFGHIHVTDAVMDEFKPRLMIEVGTWKANPPFILPNACRAITKTAR